MSCGSLLTAKTNLSTLARQSSFVKGVESQQLSTKCSSKLVVVDFEAKVMTDWHDLH